MLQTKHYPMKDNKIDIFVAADDILYIIRD